MDQKAQDYYRARASILKALAHPTRLFIVEELAKGERCVCELQQMVGADMSTVSKHLSLLKSAGIVSDEKRGNMVFYSLLCPCVLSFLECTETVLRRSAEKSLGAIR